MHDRSIGRTTIDVVTSLAVVAFIIVIVGAAVGPWHALAKKQDELRVDGVRNIMQALVELQTVAPEHLDRLRAAVTATGAPPRVMLGTGTTCAGDWGAQCGDAILSDGCIDLATFLGDYLPEAPIDPIAGFSAENTGYYVMFAPGVLEVGACEPELQDEIRLERTFF